MSPTVTAELHALGNLTGRNMKLVTVLCSIRFRRYTVLFSKFFREVASIVEPSHIADV